MCCRGVNTVLAALLAILVERPEHLSVLRLIVPLITFDNILVMENLGFILEWLK
jgi:hypothetical protein